MPKKILLADDSITIQKVVELTFSDGDYDVIAVNNGAKAIQKLAEVRPDIILSDIIMPEKNGYEVCEYVKSHPEFRRIPVILLTGTFEPFDPDRAEKAGCDAVVTKPFESQGLIHKVEELIAAAHASSFPHPEPPKAPGASAAPAASGSEWAAPGPLGNLDSGKMQSPFGSTPSFPEEESSPFADSRPAAPVPAPPAAPPVPSYGEHDAEIFSAPEAAAPPASLPFESEPASSGSTAGASFATAKYDEQTVGSSSESFKSEPETPWNEQAIPSAGETLAFPKLSFEDIQRMQSHQAEEPETSPASSEPLWATEDTVDRPASEPQQASSWPEEEAPFASSGSSIAEEPVADAVIASDASASAPAFSEPAEFEQLGQPSSFPADEPPAETSTDAFEEPPAFEDSFQAEVAATAPAETSWSPSDETIRQEIPRFEQPMAAAAVAPSHPPEAASSPVQGLVSSPAGGDLSEDQVERIARRVVQLLSDQAIRNIAWEVIPDLAENIVRERIRQLESE